MNMRTLCWLLRTGTVHVACLKSRPSADDDEELRFRNRGPKESPGEELGSAQHFREMVTNQNPVVVHCCQSIRRSPFPAGPLLPPCAWGAAGAKRQREILRRLPGHQTPSSLRMHTS